MVKTNREILSAVTLFSALGTAFLIVSLASEQWVTAHGIFVRNNSTDKNGNSLSTIKYGLFSGTFTPPLEDSAYEIKMTCLIPNNTCAYLCGTSFEDRTSQLEKLIKGENILLNETCPYALNPDLKTSRMNYSRNQKQKVVSEERDFLNAGLYISTNIFLNISLLFGLLATAFSVWIVIVNPIGISLSIYAIYTYNIVACIGSLLTIILWGTFFRTNIVHNVGILYTIQGQMDTSGMVNLGFCYWLILPSCLFYLIATVLVHTKQHPVSTELETQLIFGGNGAEEINY